MPSIYFLYEIYSITIYLPTQIRSRTYLMNHQNSLFNSENCQFAPARPPALDGLLIGIQMYEIPEFSCSQKDARKGAEKTTTTRRMHYKTQKLKIDLMNTGTTQHKQMHLNHKILCIIMALRNAKHFVSNALGRSEGVFVMDWANYTETDTHSFVQHDLPMKRALNGAHKH